MKVGSKAGDGGGGGKDDAAIHCPLLVKLGDKLGDGGTLLAHADVDTRKGIGLWSTLKEVILWSSG